MYVVHRNTLSDSFGIRIVWFQPKQDSDRIRISLFKNSIGSDSENPLSDHLWNARGFAREFLRSGMLYRPDKSLKRRGKSFSLHSKKNFLLGGAFFCEWRHKWRTFRPPWPTLSGSGRQPLGGSISLKFLLETRLQSESFDTLDDLLGFRVQKLWCKIVKIFD